MAEFYVKVVPDQDEHVINCSGTYPTIHLSAPASQGRANAALLSHLSDLLDTDVGIVSGHQSRRKKLAVDLPKNEIIGVLERAADA